VWSGHVYRVYAPRRTIAAENKRDAGQKSATDPAELDSGLSRCRGRRVGRKNCIMIKARPPRLEQIFQTYDPPLYFVTICTIHPQKIGDLEAADHAFEAYVRRARDEFGVGVGRYLIMPDHMHLFVRGGDDFKLAQWVNGLKRAVSVALGATMKRPLLAAGIFRSRVA